MAAILLAERGTVVFGQEIAFDPQPTVSCLTNAGEDFDAAANCVGEAAHACESTPEGGTTYGMVMCFRAEGQWWELRLAAAYAALMVQHRADDRELLKRGNRAMSKAESLEAMQKAWIVWRDASCKHEGALWGGGSGTGPITGLCWVVLTGRQALSLEANLRK